MKYYTAERIQIGDIKAFQQMIEDTFIQEYRHPKNYRNNFSHNDKHYQFDKKVKIDAIDS